MCFIANTVFAVNDWVGFNAGLNIDNKTNLTLGSVLTLNIDQVSGIGSINFTVQTNLDAWNLLVESDYKGLKHTVKNHVLTSNIDVVLSGSVPASYQALVVSTDVTANKTAYSGVFNYNNPTALKFYLQIQDLAQAKVGYYNTFLVLRVLTQ